MQTYSSSNPAHRQPKGDHNRRLAMGLDPEQFAAEAGVTPQALRDYEATSPDHDFDLDVAERVGRTLDRLEQVLPNSEAAGNNIATPPSSAPATLDHARHIRLTSSELTSAVLEGATIYGLDGHKVGHVSHLHGVGLTAAVIIDVGGFLGLGAKPVAVATGDLDFMRNEEGHVHALTSWTREELEAMPEHHHHH